MLQSHEAAAAEATLQLLDAAALSPAWQGQQGLLQSLLPIVTQGVVAVLCGVLCPLSPAVF